MLFVLNYIYIIFIFFSYFQIIFIFVIILYILYNLLRVTQPNITHYRGGVISGGCVAALRTKSEEQSPGFVARERNEPLRPMLPPVVHVAGHNTCRSLTRVGLFTRVDIYMAARLLFSKHTHYKKRNGVQGTWLAHDQHMKTTT